MKTLLALIIFLFCAGVHPGNAQCPTLSVDINTLPVCGVYGDANGNSIWNWELTDKFDPSYCSNWYARTDNSGNLTPMRSPFVDPSTDLLDLIALQGDFTRSKGWELLRRDFGCGQVTAYPYFILYNKYSGLMRLYIYIPAGSPTFEGIAVEIKPSAPTKYPATTAFSDTIQTAPDKYLSVMPQNFGKGMISVGELGGSANWSLVEFNPSMDPNIQNSAYENAALSFTIYGVTNNNMFARIRGGSVTSTQQIFNYTYNPSQAKVPNGSDFDFKGVGEKFTKFATGITNVRADLLTMTQTVIPFIANTYPDDPLMVRIKKIFEDLQGIASSFTTFDETFGKLAEVSKAVAAYFRVFGSIVGTLKALTGSGTSTSGPTYTTYDLVLQGTITGREIVSSMVIRTPGTLQTTTNNSTYYRCPMGIFTIKNTPEADTIKYNRTTGLTQTPHSGWFGDNLPWHSYRMKSNLAVSFNDGAGLDLVSAQAAFVGEILPKTDGTASYDPFAKHVHPGPAIIGSKALYNHMRSDFESGRLEIKQFDTKKGLHVFQSPYTDISCLNGLAFNVPATTRVYLQVKAILKKAGDPSETPIVYIESFELEKTGQTITPAQQSAYTNYPHETLPPYANYTELPQYLSDKIYTANANFTSVSNVTVKVDNVITTNNKSIIINSGANVTFIAGGEIDFKPGFEALNGSLFEARINTFGYSLTCGAATIEAYVHPVNCFNTTVAALRSRPTAPAAEDKEAELKVFPVPSPNKVYITGIKTDKNSTVSLLDQSGRTLRILRINSIDASGTASLDVSGLSNGVYFIKIQTSGTTVTRKIIVGK